MYEDHSTAGSVVCTAVERTQFAAASWEWNANQPLFKKLFAEFCNKRPIPAMQPSSAAAGVAVVSTNVTPGVPAMVGVAPIADATDTGATAAAVGNAHQCRACGAVGVALKTCSACKVTQYCSGECQKQHWPTHKAECKQP